MGTKHRLFSQAFAALGLVLLGILPIVMNNAYLGLFVATVLNAVGCGFIELISSPLFLLLIIIMICGAASEVIVGQWASLFMEQGLGFSKVIGDIMGPCMFAILMGIGRILYSVLSKKLNLPRLKS